MQKYGLNVMISRNGVFVRKYLDAKTINMIKKHINESFMKRHKLLLEYTIRDGQAPSDDSYYGGDKRIELQEADPVPDTAQGYQKKGEAPAEAQPAPEAQAAPVAPVDAMIPNMDGVEKPGGEETVDMEGDAKNDVNADGKPAAEADPNESREDILSQLIQLHSTKLKELESFAQEMGTRLGSIEPAIAEVLPTLQAGLGQVQAQVDELTPPTPLQAMEKMVDVSGGVTPEQWWNNYWKEKNQNHSLPSSPYYPRQKGDEPIAGAAPAQDGKSPQAPVYYMKAEDLPDLNPEQAKNSFLPRN